MVLDGGKKPNAPILDPSTIPVSAFNDLADINTTFDNTIEAMTGLTMKTLCLPLDGGNQSQPVGLTQQRDVKRRFIDFYRTRVMYLPETDPEDIIWNDDTAWKLCEAVVGPRGLQDFKTEILNLKTKQKFERLSTRIHGKSDGSTIDNVHSLFINKWAAEQPTSYAQIRSLIQAIKALG